MDVTIETGVGRPGGDGEGLLPQRRGVCSARGSAVPAGCQLATAALSLGSAASAQPETELLSLGGCRR